MPDATVQIKRYPNRRYYSLDTSQYVSLRDIEELVQLGKTVEIRDSQTGDDLTGTVLAQIIMDRHPDKISLFPPDMLHVILRSNDVMSVFLRDYFRHSLTYLNHVQQRSASAASFLQPAHWVKTWLDGMSPITREETEQQSPAEPAPELGPLQERLKELEERLEQLESNEE